MKTVDVIMTFRGIDLPAVEMMGSETCVLTFAQVANGRARKPGSTLFAYEEGIVWRTFLHDVEPGAYRLTLVSNDVHCSQDVCIDEDVLASGVLRVEFNRDDCRRKMIPVSLKRIWWGFRDFLDRREQHPRRDQRVVLRYRRRYRHGPIGSWISAHDNLMSYGCALEFRKDLTGTLHTWGYEDDEAAVERGFRWESAGYCAIEAQPVDGEVDPEEWGLIEYDFKASRNAYGRREVLMFSKNRPEFASDAPGFWWFPHPVVLADKGR
jgi:hypothetical protein